MSRTLPTQAELPNCQEDLKSGVIDSLAWLINASPDVLSALFAHAESNGSSANSRASVIAAIEAALGLSKVCLGYDVSHTSLQTEPVWSKQLATALPNLAALKDEDVVRPIIASLPAERLGCLTERAPGDCLALPADRATTRVAAGNAADFDAFAAASALRTDCESGALLAPPVLHHNSNLLCVQDALVSEVVIGPIRKRVDRALPLRKAAFECLARLVDRFEVIRIASRFPD